MKRMRAIVAGIGVVAGLFVPVAANASAVPQVSPAATVNGCPSGYVCIYPEGKGWNGGVWDTSYYSYGVHALYDEYNLHNIENNQTGGAVFALCYDYAGTDCTIDYNPGSYANYNLTPFNSIRLDPYNTN